MSITLYDLAAADTAIRFSPHCWKSRLALSHKQLEHDTVPVGFTEKDKIAMSGQGLLPVLTDGATVVNDSWDIALYLESQYPQRATLFMDNAAELYALSVNNWCDDVLSHCIRPLVVMPIYDLITADDDDRDYFRQSREERLGISLEAYADKAPESVVVLNKELDELRERLSGQPYLNGQASSYADICVLSMFLWMACSSPVELVDIGFTHKDDLVYEWYLRMLQRYSDVIPSRLL